MPEIKDALQFFRVGGTLSLDVESYVRRSADDELLRYTLAGEYCNVLTARQMGKSSLMVRTAEALKHHGVRTVIIDLTAIGTAVSSSEWYFGLLNRLTRGLSLGTNLQDWWESHAQQSPIQRFSEFLRLEVLEKIADPIVVFIDEIDTTLKLDFTDDFFAAIRAAYNARANEPLYKNLSFVLLGVVRPADLMKERTRTPYNIGENINMTDFQIDELESYIIAMEMIYPGQGNQTVQWVLDWTGGQPYLTQKMCAELVTHANGRLDQEDINLLVEALFLGEKARTESNLRSIRDRALAIPNYDKTLRLYRRVLKGKRIVAEERSIEQNELKLTGLVSVSSGGILRPRNRIYSHVFDEKWVRDSLPVSVTQILAIVMTIVAVIAIAVSAYLYWRSKNQEAEILAQTYTEGFQTSSSPEVRVTNLAGLFSLGGDYKLQARDLFFSQSTNDQLSLFQLPSPQNVGEQLVVVVEELYQYIPVDSHGNALLASMAEALSQTAASGAPGLATEIEFWLQARDLVAQGQDGLAITLFTRVLEQSQSRQHMNTGALIDRAQAHTRLAQYDEALNDFEELLIISANWQDEVVAVILSNDDFVAYWRDNSQKYVNLLEYVPLPTEEVVSSPTQALPTITPTETRPPTLTPEPDSTPEPTITSLPQGVLFAEDFEGELNDFRSPNIKSEDVVELDGNKVLLLGQRDGKDEIMFGSSSWSDYSFEFDMMVLERPPTRNNSYLEAIIRTSSERYYSFGWLLIPNNLRYECSFEGGYRRWDMHVDSQFYPNPQVDTWYHIKLEVIDTLFNSYIDDKLWLTARDFIKCGNLRGYAGIVYNNFGEFIIDNIFVEEIIQP